MSATTNDDQLLKRLAVAIVESPRSTIKELAESVGISKATLHRFCGTRENLEKLLYTKAWIKMDEITAIADKEYENYREGLKRLIQTHLENKEYLRIFATFNSCIEEECFPYMKSMDAFFLRGQKQGTFRIELSVAELSELFATVIYGMIDAERRGRIAPIGMMESIENFFLYGTANEIR